SPKNRQDAYKTLRAESIIMEAPKPESFLPEPDLGLAAELVWISLYADLSLHSLFVLMHNVTRKVNCGHYPASSLPGPPSLVLRRPPAFVFCHVHLCVPVLLIDLRARFNARMPSPSKPRAQTVKTSSMSVAGETWLPRAILIPV